LGTRQIADIKRSELVRLLDHIEDANGPVMADRTLATIRKIMNWHASRSDEFRSPIVPGMARTSSKERARERILSDDELRALWTTAESFYSVERGPLGPLLQFLLLTGARRSEAAGMMWRELEDADWMLPAARNKVKVDLVRPLSGAAVQTLAKLPRIKNVRYVFSGGADRALSGFSNFRRRVQKHAGVADWTLHDLRRTARSLMSRAGVSPDHAERCLGHVIGGVRGTYDRHEFYHEKKRAYEALAALILMIVNPSDNVVSLIPRTGTE
jgi:integrase